MKKISILLAMLLCLVPVLGACGAQSSPEKLVAAAYEATYEDFDYEVFNEICYNLNLELYEEVLEGDDLKAAKETIRSAQDMVKEGMKSLKENVEDYEDYDFVYEIRYCEVYDEEDDEFDDAIAANSTFNDTDFEDLIDEIARVRVVGEVYYTDEDGEEGINELDDTFTCYRIDGKWYIGFND